ncbi:RraA family protein [Alteromonas sp. ASW11-130]|uniref:RraA family protein n=1 Tax=Alteromonas sp. ASW11-130 TaxID=3015775 RepID=UPI0022423D57|nr:RraA family protein [Alteromonas sp. ASW11-130]MCW8090732.1 RraA family protein [Alteromonas sp. ASW11-130]
MREDIRALWPQTQRLAGSAFTVECPPNDHIMFHAAIYRVRPGDVLVVKGDERLAPARPNVCAIAQKNGIQGMIVDGYVRDVAEITALQFPIYAKGCFPKPAAKKALGSIRQPISCGGVDVENGDIVVADEDGIAVIPFEQRQSTYDIARRRNQTDNATTLEGWQKQHLEKVKSTLTKLEFTRQS